MAHDGMAPKLFGRLTKRKGLLNALLFTIVFSLLSLLTSFIAADTVFVLLMSIAGISVTISWMGIAMSQFMFRKKYVKAGGKVENLKFKVSFYPFVPLFCIGTCLIILIFLAYDPSQRVGLFYGVGFFFACLLFHHFKREKQNHHRNHDQMTNMKNIK